MVVHSCAEKSTPCPTIRVVAVIDRELLSLDGFEFTMTVPFEVWNCIWFLRGQNGNMLVLYLSALFGLLAAILKVTYYIQVLFFSTLHRAVTCSNATVFGKHSRITVACFSKV